MIESLYAPEQFPILDRLCGKHGEKLIYLDSAATSLVPERVIVATNVYLRTSCSNIHRGAHMLAEESTDIYETAREHVTSFLNLDSPQCALFTHGATESLNMVASGWAQQNLHQGDVVVIAEDNHHANIVCWQMLEKSLGVRLEWIPVLADGTLDYDAWCVLAEQNPKLVALCHLSNVLGFEQPDLRRIIADAHRCKATIVLDAAQSAGHRPLSITDEHVDFLAFSAHKMMGFGGVGVLACAPDALAAMVPTYGGGGMIERVDRDGFTATSAPGMLEAGTPAIVAVVALQEALCMIEETGLSELAAHTSRLCSIAHKGLQSIEGASLVGSSEILRESLITFTVDGVHPHDVSRMLSDVGIAVRAGHHCAMPLHLAVAVPASVRASFGGYSTERDVHALIEAVARMAGGRH